MVGYFASLQWTNDQEQLNFFDFRGSKNFWAVFDFFLIGIFSVLIISIINERT
jgi:hypothetical protein